MCKKRSVIAASLTIVSIIAVSSIYVSFLQQQQVLSKTSHGYTIPISSITAPFAAAGLQQWSSSAQDSNNNNLLNFSTKAMIAEFIASNPGVYLREVSEDLQLTLSVVQYHVWNLMKDGQVEEYRNGRYRRFFPAGVYQELEQKVISLMREETASKIIILLSKDRCLSNSDLALALGLTSQALSWQLSRLKTMGLIEVPLQSAPRSYHLNYEASVILSKYL